jgi:hypothetical protein
MNSGNEPQILVVDDHPDGERGTVASWRGVRVHVLHPQDVDRSDLKDADLVAIDLKLEDWPQRAAVEAIAMQPLNGLVLAAVLRAHAEAERGTPTAFALRSAHLPDLTAPFPSEPRLHVLSRQCNLEWVFPKADNDPQKQNDQVQQMVSLAQATKALPDHWPDNDAEATREIIEKWLAVPKERWQPQGWRDIEECHPPVHNLSLPVHGLLFLRWFLHQILPYPCFLWTTHRLATRLRVTHQSLLNSLRAGLAGVFAEAKYCGQLSGFLGEHWWRSGCEAIIWDLTAGNPFDPDRVRTILNERCGARLEPCAVGQPVNCVDENYQPIDDDCDVSAVVRLQPDDWPPYAEQACTTRRLASESPRLRAVTVDSDREMLSTEGPVTDGEA